MSINTHTPAEHQYTHASIRPTFIICPSSYRNQPEDSRPQYIHTCALKNNRKSRLSRFSLIGINGTFIYLEKLKRDFRGDNLTIISLLQNKKKNSFVFLKSLSLTTPNTHEKNLRNSHKSKKSQTSGNVPLSLF